MHFSEVKKDQNLPVERAYHVPAKIDLEWSTQTKNLIKHRFKGKNKQKGKMLRGLHSKRSSKRRENQIGIRLFNSSILKQFNLGAVFSENSKNKKFYIKKKERKKFYIEPKCSLSIRTIKYTVKQGSTQGTVYSLAFQTNLLNSWCPVQPPFSYIGCLVYEVRYALSVKYILDFRD